MKTVLLFCAITAASASPVFRQDAFLTNWESHGELMTDLHLDAVPSDMIDAINNNESLTWTAGVNRVFAGASLEEAKVLMGTLQNTDTRTYLPYKEITPVDIPTEFDWRTDPRAKNCPSVSEIRDQANCGSCWAFGSVEALTDRGCINGTSNVHLSAQDVASCDKLGDMGCSGGVPSSVYSYSASFGIVDGGNYGDNAGCLAYKLAPCAHHVNGTSYPPCPPEVSVGACPRKCDNGKGWEGSKHRSKGGYSVCAQGMNGKCADAMAQDIYQNGPITGMFFVKQDFLAYKSGVYTPSLFSPMLGGHAIKIMGYGTEGGTPYWLVANSWNADWGDKGYFKIKRGVDAAQIENPIINGGPVAGHMA